MRVGPLWLFAALLALLAFGLARVARAQSVPAGGAGVVVVPPKPGDSAQPAPKAPVVTPPVLKKNEAAAYPKQAIDDGVREKARVKLALDVDATGVVKAARVVEGAGHGFDEAAVAAAQKLEFAPATRDGKPFAAVIPFVYEFTPPPGALSGRVVRAVGERAIAGAVVTVRDEAGAEKTATTDADGGWRIAGLPAGKYHVTVSASGMAAHDADEEVAPGQEVSAVDRLTPVAGAGAGAVAGAGAGAGAGADAGAATEVVETVEVRGEKPPREVTKFTVDQREMSRIPGTGGDALRSLQNLPGVARPPGLAGLLIVRGSAPQDTQYFIDGTPVPLVYHFGGLSSVVPTEILDRIDFYPGNYGSQYGRALGGIVDVGLRDPKKDKLHGMAELDLIDVRAIAEGPIGDGWSFTLGGRRSWFDLWLGPVLKAAGANVSVAPVYYDYQAILEKDLGKKSSLRFAVFGSDDLFKVLLQNAAASNPQLAGTIGSHMGFFRAQALYKNKLSDDTELRAVAAAGADYTDFDLGDNYFHIASYPVSGRIEVAQHLSKRLIMNVGTDMIWTPYQADVRFPAPPKAGQPPGGPFLQTSVQTSAKGSIYTPAIYTEFEATPWTGTRIVPGVRVDYADNSKSWDLQPRLIVRQDITRDPRTTIKGGVGIYTQPPLPQQTDPVFGTPGVINERSTQYDVGVERQLTDHIEVSVEGFYKDLVDLYRQGLGSTGSGDVYGVETLIRYKDTPDGRFFGWLAYTLSRAERRDQPGAPLMTFQFDETHVLTVLGSYRLGRGWEIGARFRLTSGYMYTPQQYGFYDENSSSYLPLSAYPPNGTRLPLFHQLDIRIDKGWKYKWGSLSVYLDVLNVYNQGNVLGVSYNYNSTNSIFANDLPILPSLGIRGEL